jgi:uncharacterized membrane protein
MLNPRVSNYWSWLAIAFGGICVLPVIHDVPGSHRYILATAYAHPEMFGYQSLLLLHTAAAVFIAVILSAISFRQSINESERDRTQFRLRDLVLVVTCVAILISCFSWLHFPSVVSIALLVVIAGRYVTYFAFWVVGTKTKR